MKASKQGDGGCFYSGQWLCAALSLAGEKQVRAAGEVAGERESLMRQGNSQVEEEEKEEEEKKERKSASK